MSLDLKKMKDALAASEAVKEKQKEEDERKKMQEEQAARDKEQAEAQAKRTLIVRHYATTFFAGDTAAAEAFVKVYGICLGEQADLTNDEDPTNDPKTQAEDDEFLLKRIIWHLERDSVLSKWMKDHGRDPNKLGPELARIRPQRPGSGQSPAAFDVAKYGSTGSGFWISADGWLLTNEHVVTDAKTVDLLLSDGKTTVQARVMKTDEAADLALLKADLTTPSWVAVSKSEIDLKRGHKVFTVGYPDPRVLGSDSKFTEGTISAPKGFEGDNDSYQTAVPVLPGNSGGALMDRETGWVVGVINAKFTKADNVSYAIKGRVVRAFLDSIPAAREAVAKALLKPPAQGEDVVERATQAAVLILRPR
jgi:S1-C subfamily serine protease